MKRAAYRAQHRKQQPSPSSLLKNPSLFCLCVSFSILNYQESLLFYFSFEVNTFLFIHFDLSVVPQIHYIFSQFCFSSHVVSYVAICCHPLARWLGKLLLTFQKWVQMLLVLSSLPRYLPQTQFFSTLSWYLLPPTHLSLPLVTILVLFGSSKGQREQLRKKVHHNVQDNQINLLKALLFNVCSGESSSSPQSLLEMQNFNPTPDLLNQNVNFNKEMIHLHNDL